MKKDWTIFYSGHKGQDMLSTRLAGAKQDNGLLYDTKG